MMDFGLGTPEWLKQHFKVLCEEIDPLLVQSNFFLHINLFIWQMNITYSWSSYKIKHNVSMTQLCAIYFMSILKICMQDCGFSIQCVFMQAPNI